MKIRVHEWCPPANENLVEWYYFHAGENYTKDYLHCTYNLRQLL